MTYKENEFPMLLEKLNEYSETVYPVNEVVKWTYRIYKQVPVYPGIVDSCLEKMVIPLKLSDLKRGDHVILTRSDGFIEGEVVKVDLKGRRVLLKDVKLLKRKKRLNAKLHGEEVIKIDDDVLKRLWPSLSHKEKKR